MELAVIGSNICDLPGHDEMVLIIAEALPAIQADIMAVGGKRQSQFMDRVLTCSQSTPFRNLRQLLAGFEKVREALEANQFRLRKKQIQAAMLREKMAAETGLKADLLGVQAEEIEAGIESSKQYISGAIRKAAEYVKQREAIMAHLGITEITEEIIEANEEEHHVRTMLAQGINSARASGTGRLDEGNSIYCYQLGISVALVNFRLRQLFDAEQALLAAGKVPPHEMVEDFLGQMVAEFKGCSEKVTASRGLSTGPVQLALCKQG
jgi:hypothetical protein